MPGAEWLEQCIHQEMTFLMDRSLLLLCPDWRCICPFQYKNALRTWLYLSNGRVSKSIEGKIGVCTVIQNNGTQSGAKGLNRRCLLLITGQELFSFNRLLMCRQWNISSAYSQFPSSNCISSFTVTHLQKLQQIRAGLQYRLILLSFLLLLLTPSEVVCHETSCLTHKTDWIPLWIHKECF